MMPWLIGKDPETNELLVVDNRSDSIFLRGSQDSYDLIVELVNYANRKYHSETTGQRQSCVDTNEDKLTKLVEEAEKILDINQD